MRSVLRRPVLLLSAAATITVPGALAVLAVLGHHHDDTAVAGQSAPLGAELSQAGGQEMMLPAAERGTMPDPEVRTMASASAAAAADRARGLQLLSQAAAAGSAASYQGVEAIADTTVTGPSNVTATVWHRAGGATVTRVSGGQPEEAYDSDGRAPEGVFGVTAATVGLLDKNYVPMYLGTGTVVGRPALIVAVQRADGTTAAQFWLDKSTLVPLRRDLYDTSAHVVSDDRFTQVTFGQAKMPKTAAGPATAWATAPSPVQLLSTLNGEGCLLPRTLPGDLSLYAASDASTPSGQVADFGFSDGLSVVSLFVERGVLPAKMPGWQQDRIAGHAVYVTQHEVTMSGNGFVYTVIADAPPETVDAVVAALPDNSSPGILGRLRRGLSRMASVLNPFS